MAEARLDMSWMKTIRGGLRAGLAQTAAVYIIATVFGLPVVDMSEFVGAVLVGSSPSVVAVGRWLFALMALVWALAYRVVGPALPGPAWQRGILYGALVWTFSTTILLPLLASISTHGPRPGLFGLGFGGASAMLTALAAHLVYGVVLATTVHADERPAVPESGPA